MKKYLISMHIFLFREICKDAKNKNKTIKKIIIEILANHYKSKITDDEFEMIINIKDNKSHADMVLYGKF